MRSHAFSGDCCLLKRLAPLLVVLFGFAVRVYAVDATWIDGDRANPHGVGIVLLDALARGDWRAIPLFSDDASIGLPNSPLLSYVYAVVALSGRSLGMAVLLGLAANTIAVVAAFAAGRRAAGWHAGLISATLLAGSNWGVYLARGTWHPTPIESGATLSVALLLLGLSRNNARFLIAGFAVAALTAFSYVGAFILLPQTLFATLAAGGSAPALRRVWWQGALICIATVVLYGVLLAAGGRLPGIANLGLLKSDTQPLSEPALPARDVSAADRDPWGHFMRLATNADYALTWTDPSLPLYGARRGIEDGLAAVLSTAAVAGLILMAWRARNRQGAASRFLLAWALLPLLTLAALALRKADFGVQPVLTCCIRPLWPMSPSAWLMPLRCGLRVRQISARRESI